MSADGSNSQQQPLSGGGAPSAAPGGGTKFKFRVKAPGAASAVANHAPAPVLAPVPQPPAQPKPEPPAQPKPEPSVQPKPEPRDEMSLLEDSDDEVQIVHSSGVKRPSGGGAARRSAAVLDDSDSSDGPKNAPKASKSPPAPQVKKQRVSASGEGKPRVSSAPAPSNTTSASQGPAKPSKSTKSTQQRTSGRNRRATEKAIGAEEDEDPDDLEALREFEIEDEDYVDAGALVDEEWSDEEDMYGGAGSRGAGRRRAKAPKGKQGKTAAEVRMNEHGELVPAAMGQTDFSELALKPDHAARPLWATPDGHIFLETFSPVYKQAQDFLIAIAEPVCRPEYVHEYQLTPHSLYAAVSVGLDTDTIISVLGRLSKVNLDQGLKNFIIAATQNYGKVKLVLKRNHFMVETSDPHVFNVLWKDSVISEARLSDEVFTEKALKERAVAGITRVNDAELLVAKAGGTSQAPAAVRGPNNPLARSTAGPSAPGGSKNAVAALPAAAAATQLAVSARGFYGSGADMARGSGSQPKGGNGVSVDDEGSREGGRLSIDDVEEGTEEDKVVRAFEIKGDMVEVVKKRCMPGVNSLNYPMLEEYDFRGDRNTPDLNMELRPHVKLRPYQEKSLSKMFGNGRARSGIIVLPCGAGKSLVGVAAAARIRKSCLCLCTSSVSVDQWKHQFMMWTNLQDHQVARFTSDTKEMFAGDAGIMITTFTMVAFSGKRSEESEKVMAAIRSREWGLLLMDEVHVVPAQMFRKVVGIIHSHCKLGLTATLVREDERIGDLNFLIGPKLYEANWLDLTRAGHIANVQCVEVWCPMTREFYREYLKPENSNRKQLLYCMNPNKFAVCQFLINWHEHVRKDKIIVFSDNIWALREYATQLKKPFIYGPTSHAERTRVLHAFKNDPNVNTVFLSKVGDNSLDIPEANVLIQISSHAGSRRQEAQRLGRILRAKRAKSGPVSSNEFNAFFYTLVSQDTQEMYYSTKRQQFLIDQGYAFKVATDLVPQARASLGDELKFAERPQQLDLLCRVLTAGLDEAGVEVGAKDKDEEELAEAAGKGGVRRTAGDIRALTGAMGRSYMEYRLEAGPAELYRPAGSAIASGAARGGAKKSSEIAKKMHKKLAQPK